MRDKLLPSLQLVYLAICSFGIQFASSLQMANTSSVYKFLGVESSSLPYLWLAAPIAGLIMQPLIGQMSDDTLTRYGKRRPYLLTWGIITCLGFCLLPLVDSIQFAVILFWLIGFSINACMEALRALTGDIVPNLQKTQAFSWQTILAGIGAGFAAILPWLLEPHVAHWHSFFTFTKIPFSIQAAFLLGGILLLSSIIWTCQSVKEKRPTHQELLKKQKESKQTNTVRRLFNFAHQIITNLNHLPKIIKDFIGIQIFTWVSLFCLWLFFSLALAQHVYGLPIGADIIHNPEYKNIMTKSAVKTDFYFSIYQFTSVIYAIALPKLTQIIKTKLLYGFSLLIGAISLISITFCYHNFAMIMAMFGIGIMWGGITVLPYAMVSAEVPRSKMGIYLGIFNITITLPQILVGVIIGPIFIHIFHRHAIYVILIAGISMLIASLMTLSQVTSLRIYLLRIFNKQCQI